MATSLTRFEPRKTLDDLPEEILENIYKQLFGGMRVRLHGYDKAMQPLWLLNKKQSRIARSAMFAHAVIKLDNYECVGRLLSTCSQLERVRYLHITNYSASNHHFTLMDDLLRAMSGLIAVSVVLSFEHTAYDENGRELKDDPTPFLLQAIKHDAPWTRRIVSNALGDYIDVQHNAVCLIWLKDIVEGKAFAGRSNAPEVSVDVEFTVSHYENEELCGEFTAPTLSFCPTTRSLTGILDSQPIVLHQTHVKARSYAGRGGRGLICDAAVIDKALQNHIEGILGRHLLAMERVRLAEFESTRNIASGIEDLETEVYLAMRTMYCFDLQDAACRQVIRSMEETKQPKLRLEHFDQTRALLVAIIGERFGDYEDMMLQRVWSNKRFVSVPKSVLDVHELVMQVSARGSLHCNIWWNCYKELYFERVDLEGMTW